MVSRRRWAAAGVAVAAFWAVTASAATLGGFGSQSLGAGSTVVTPCDSNGIAVSYVNDYDAATDSYRTVEVALGDVAPACDGLSFRLMLATGSGSLRELTGLIQLAGGTRHVVAVAPSIDAATITRTALTMTG